MTNAEKHYFTLLRAAIWDTPANIDGPIDWKEVLRIAKHHATQTLICGTASLMEGDNKPKPEALAWMQNAMRNNLVFHLRLKRAMLTAVKMLRDNGIDPVVLKGFTLAMYYPNPELRQFGDIDLYVGLNQFHQACEVLRHMEGSYNWGKERVEKGRHYNIEFGDFAIETHHSSADIFDPKEKEVYDRLENDGLVQNAKHLNFEGTDITVPSDEFAVFFTFFHAWHHFMTTGVGWRQLCDLALILHACHGHLDLNKLEGFINDMKLTTPWQTFGQLIVEHLALPQAEMPFYNGKSRRKAEKLYRRIMEEGNFNRQSSFKQHRPKHNKLLRKAHAFLGIFIDAFHLATIFPDVAFREMRTELKLGFGKMHSHNKTH